MKSPDAIKANMQIAVWQIQKDLSSVGMFSNPVQFQVQQESDKSPVLRKFLLQGLSNSQKEVMVTQSQYIHKINT